MAHILVDTANTFFRARHVIRGDTSEKVGMAIHIMMNSIKKAWQDFGGTHVVSVSYTHLTLPTILLV